MSRFKSSFAAVAFGLATCIASAHAADADTPEQAAQRYFQAEAQFDLKALESVLDPGFVEISPIGEVDERDKVLSFYAPDKKVATPPVQIAPFQTRLHGDTAVLTTQFTYQVQGQSRSLTVGLVAKRGDTGWKLLSAQYTGVRPKAAPAATAKPQ